MDLREYEMHLRDKRYAIEHMTAYPRGAIIGRVLLTRCFKLPIPIPHPHTWMMQFEQPEVFPEPIPYTGSATFFYVNTDVARRLPPRYPFTFPKE